MGPVNSDHNGRTIICICVSFYLESKKRRPRATGDKFEKFSFLFFAQSSHDLPEDDDCSVGLCEPVSVLGVLHLEIHEEVKISSLHNKLFKTKP